MPTISIITPVYNGGRYLAETIQNVLDQTFQDWELIIVNDGSTDNTCEIVNRYRSDRLCFIQQANQGVSVARNTGLKASKGQYIIFLDADDWWDPSCLELLLQTLQNVSLEYALVHSNWAFAADKDEIGIERSSTFRHGDGLRSLVIYNPFPIHAALIRRSALESIGGFGEEIPTLEDWELWIRLALGGYKFYYLPNLLAYYRWYAGSKSKNYEKRKIERLKILDRFWARDNIPDEIQLLKSQSYVSAQIDFCVSQFGHGNVPAALEELEQAVRIDPECALDIDLYYRIAYANQAVVRAGQKHLSEHLDEKTAIRNTNTVIRYFKTNNLISSNQLIIARWTALSSIATALYSEGYYTRSRLYIIRALRCNLPSSLFQKNNLLMFVKTFLPPRFIAFLKKYFKEIYFA